MRVIVCGSRYWTSSQDRDLVFLILDLFKMGLDEKKINLVVIEGECYGVDIWAREWAIARKVEYLPFPADWSQGNAAGPRRNLKMLREGKPDLVIAFTDDLATAKGTKNMVELAQKNDVATQIYSRGDIRALLDK